MTQVNVLEKHIKNGEPRECRTCPVALAIMDTFPGVVAEVGCDDVSIWPAKEAYKNLGVDEVHLILLPYVARNAISAFDSFFEVDRKIEPFSFELEYPV